MAKVQLDSAARNNFGKGAARQLRREGRVPAVIYGGNREAAHISVPAHDLMMALKQIGVVLEVQVDGAAVNVAPRQVQKDPVRGDIEHVDLLVLSDREVRERLVVGAALAKAEKVAADEELDTVTVVTAVRELLDEGVEPDDAIDQAVAAIKEEQAAAASAAAAVAAAEDAAEEAEGEAGEAAAAEAAE